MADAHERKRLIDQAHGLLLDEIKDTVKQFSALGTPQISDDYESIHQRLLYITALEADLGHLYRQSLEILNEVVNSKDDSEEILEDSKMAQSQKPSFKNPTAYMSRPEYELKLRSLTIEEVHGFKTWKTLVNNSYYIRDIISSYQRDADRERRVVDTRLKILGTYY